MTTTCKNCGHTFDITRLPECRMGMTECPSCHVEVDQEGYFCEGKLTTKARKALPKKQFVFQKDRRYPIHDRAHARNALSRVSQHGTPAEKAKVRAAVHRKFPKIGKKAEESIARILGKPLQEGQLVELGGYWCALCKAARTPNWKKTDDQKDYFPACPKCGHDMRKMANEALSEKLVILLLNPPEMGKCTKCGGENQELRPYGDGGTNVCFKCGMADEPSTAKRFLDLFNTAVAQGEQEMVAREAASNAQGYGYLSKPQIQG